MSSWFAGDLPPVKIGTVDIETGFVRLTNGRWTTIEEIIKESDGGGTDFTKFCEDKTRTTAVRPDQLTENDVEGLRGALIYREAIIKRALCEKLTPEEFNEIIDGTGLASDLVKELLLFYATAPLDLATAARIANTISKAHKVEWGETTWKLREGQRGFVKNGHLAGSSHPVTKVPFDKHGFPVFDSLGDVVLPKKLISPKVTDTDQFKHATQELWKKIKSKPKLQAAFTSKQLEQIKAGTARIEGLTWHHHQDGKTLQLVDRAVHGKTGHTGGRQLTGGRPH